MFPVCRPRLRRRRSVDLLAALGVIVATVCSALAAADEPADTAKPAPATKSADAPKLTEPPKAAESPKPAAPATKPAPPAASNGKLTFNFRYQPWQDVLDWFAQQNDMSLVIESPPPGTFNYRDGREYTPAEALDVINSVLLTKGYTLVRNGRMLVLVNLEDGIPPNLVPDVQLADLDQHGEYEIMRVLFPVWNMTPDAAAKEIEPLLGPQGSVIVLPQARQIQVTETGGRLRTIRRVINYVERPTDEARNIREITLKNLSFDDAMPFLRQMVGIPEEAFVTTDGLLRVGKDVTGWRMLVQGTPERIARVEEVLKLIDVPEAARGISGAPQLEVYPVTTADPQSVLQVLQTLLAGDTSVKLATDPVTGHLIAFARPAQQATIRATIDQMQHDSRQVAVIPLSTVDPQLAVVSVNRLFGGLEKDKPDPSAPRVDADNTTRSLLVRGTSGQVAQIRDLLKQLGEGEEGAATNKSQEHVRLLPLTGGAARSALSQIEQVWPTMRPNRIRIVTPAQSIPTFTPSDNGSSSDDQRGAPSTDRNLAPALPKPPADTRPVAPKKDESTFEDVRDSDRVAIDDGPNGIGRTVSLEVMPAIEGGYQLSDVLHYVDNQVEKTGPSRVGAPIVVAPGPGGVLIASDDLEALNEFEQLLTSVAGRNTAATRDYAVFYLKFSKAANVADVLSAIFGGSATRGGGVVNNLAGAALGDLGGGVMGDLLLGGGGAASTGGFTSSSVDIVPDVRLNALIVRAKQADIDMVEELLRVLDQKVGPAEVEADSRPRLIPCFNVQASEIAQVVQQIYQDRMAGAGAGGGMSPADMLKMIRGGRGGQDVEQQVPKMSIGIDSRSNSLIVRAPDALFEEVKALVAELDQSQLDSPETTRIVSLKHTNSAAVQKALSSMLGKGAVTTNKVADSRPATRGGDEDNSADEQARRNFRRQMEMFRDMRDFQRMQQGGGRGFPGGPGGPGFGPPGGNQGGPPGDGGGRRGRRGGGE